MKTILVIDDDPIYQLLVRKMLGKIGEGHIVKAFLNISDYLNEIFDILKNESNQIIILLDINIPGMSGWDFLEEYLAADFNKDHIKVYLVSSSVDREDHEKSLNNQNIIKFYSKPLYTADFELILNS